MSVATVYDDLVDQLEQVDMKNQAMTALRAAGEKAKPALLRGLDHASYRVRHGCLIVLDHTVIDDPTRLRVLKAMADPNRKVRRAALHLLSCEVCKPEGYCGIEGVDLEALCLELARHDPSQRVRRSAMGNFMWRSSLGEDLSAAVRQVLESDPSHEVRKRAAMALAFPEVAQESKRTDRRISSSELQAFYQDKVQVLLSHSS